MYSYFCLVSLVLSVICAPFPVEQRAVSVGDISAFDLYEQYAAAAYCRRIYNTTTGSRISCRAGVCPLVEEASATLVIEFEIPSQTDVTGFVATDPSNKLVIVSFRGSASIRNWITDFDFPLVDISLCPGCRGQRGFWRSWLDARDDVLTAVKTAASSSPSYKIVVTGHSLGGAIAAFAAAELRNLGHVVDLCSFGQPRVGDQTTSQYITSQAPTQGQNYRFTHMNDPVPRMPPAQFGYDHVSPEYYISTPNEVPVTAGDISIYYGLNEDEGNAAWVMPNLLSHMWYFNSIADCQPWFLGLDK